MESRSFNARPGFRGAARAIAMALAVGFRAAPGRMSALAVLRVVTEFGGPVQAWGLKLLTDAVVNGDASAATWAAVLIAGTVVLTDGMSWLLIGTLMGVRERVGQEMDRRLVTLATRVPGIEHYERPDYQDELQMLRNQRAALANIPDAAISNIGLVVRAVTTIGLLAALHPALALLPLFGIPAVATGGLAERRRQAMFDRTAQRNRRLHWLYATATQPQHGKELRVFRAREGVINHHDELSAEVSADWVATEARSSALAAGGWVVFAAGFIGAIGLVAWQAATGRATPGDVVLTLSLANQINNQLTGAVSTVGFLVRTVRVGHRYLWLSDYAEAATAATRPATPIHPPDRLHRGIHFEQVSFTYPGTEVTVLRDVNLLLPAGATVAVVGDNGAGKSTLVKLLCRFYEPTQGRITVDGVPLASMEPEEWRTRISAGFQDFAKFELLAREAVGIGDLPRMDEEPAVTAALDRANAGDVVADLPNGLSSQLGRTFEGGVELSGGQWQKLALGRAMMREVPLLLLLDEPTSALDAKTEHALFERYAAAASEAASKLGAVTVLVSHRFSTVRMADLILVVEQGRIAESGTHAELMAEGGTYAELFETQARAYR